MPLLNNYLGMLTSQQVIQTDLHILPNGLPILNSNPNEVHFLYKEIFEDHCYLKHGITLNEDSCVVDIGANAGFLTVYLNLLSEDIKVYSIEPIPEVFNYLVANRQLYNIKGKALQYAIMDAEQDIDFTYYPDVTIVSGISQDTQDKNEVRNVVKSFIQNSESGDLDVAEIDSMLEVKLVSKNITVHAKTLSQIIAEENIEKIDLLKVDVENAEHLVIKGILEKDWDKIGSIIIEVHDSNGRLNIIKDILDKRGFHTHVEKEQMLSKDDILYNLFAIKGKERKSLGEMGDRDILRANEWINPEQLEKMVRKDIEGKLPDFMVPAHFILLDKFPLTVNGKIDKKALLDPVGYKSQSPEDELPESETELAVSRIWKNLLQL